MSLADELSKLDELHRRGVLSDSEFQVAKHRLLSVPGPSHAGGGPSGSGGGSGPSSMLDGLRREPAGGGSPAPPPAAPFRGGGGGNWRGWGGENHHVGAIFVVVAVLVMSGLVGLFVHSKWREAEQKHAQWNERFDQRHQQMRRAHEQMMQQRGLQQPGMGSPATTQSRQWNDEALEQLTPQQRQRLREADPDMPR